MAHCSLRSPPLRHAPAQRAHPQHAPPQRQRHATRSRAPHVDPARRHQAPQHVLVALPCRHWLLRQRPSPYLSQRSAATTGLECPRPAASAVGSAPKRDCQDAIADIAHAQPRNGRRRAQRRRRQCQ
eukprot:352821-Chlamydomonas_euryale.AAC.17